MKPTAAATAFGLALWLALLVVSVFDVYILDHFDGSIGTRLVNVLLNAAVHIGLALFTALGFAAVLCLRRQNVSSYPGARIWLPVSVLVAGTLIYCMTFLGPVFWGHFGTWWLSMGIMSAYCFVTGALIAAVLTWTLGRLTLSAAQE